MADDGSWIDHIAYCGGKNNTCQTPIVFTVANVSLTSPGVMTHWYVFLVVNCNPIFLLSFAEIHHRHRKQIESWGGWFTVSMCEKFWGHSPATPLKRRYSFQPKHQILDSILIIPSFYLHSSLSPFTLWILYMYKYHHSTKFCLYCYTAQVTMPTATNE